MLDYGHMLQIKKRFELIKSEIIIKFYFFFRYERVLLNAKISE